MNDDNRSSAALTVTATGSSAEAVGTTVITEEVVAQIAGIAARQVNGVAALVGRSRGLQVVGWERLLPVGHGRGVTVRVRNGCVEIDVDLIAQYPAPLQRMCDAVRIAVTEAVETFVGLRVVEVNITVADITIRPSAAREWQKDTQPHETHRAQPARTTATLQV